MQRQLALEGGHHAGPLFIPQKRRAPRLISGFDGSRRIWGMIRRGCERRATPRWNEPGHVRAFYRLARIYTMHAGTGVRYSVEHEVPLVHPLVCGLHTPANLAVIPLLDNVSKGNRWGQDQLALL